VKIENVVDVLKINELNLRLDAPIIGIGRLIRWYRLIVICTIGKYKFIFITKSKRT